MMNRFIPTLILFLFAISLQAQSPWTQKMGGGFGQLSFMSIPSYDSFFANDADTSRISAREYSEFAAQFYVEYGILRNTTLILDAPLKVLNAAKLDSLSLSNKAGTLTSLGNTRLSVRHSFLSKGVALAGQLMVEFPTGKYEDATGLRTGYDAFTVLPSISVGGGLGKGYIYGYGGVGFRTNDYSHYFNGGIEGGYHPFEKFWVMVFFDTVRSFKNGERIEPIHNIESGFYVNDQEWASAGLKLLYNINDNIGLTASTTLAAFAANQVPESPSLAIGVFMEW